MSTVPLTKSYLAYVTLLAGALLALPLWREFRVPGQVVWNLFLAAFLIALVATVFFGVRYLQKNKIEVGEARFTSSDADC